MQNAVAILKELTVQQLKKVKLPRDGCSHYDLLAPFAKVGIYLCLEALAGFKTHEILRGVLGIAHKRPTIGRTLVGNRDQEGVKFWVPRQFQKLSPTILALVDGPFQVAIYPSDLD